MRLWILVLQLAAIWEGLGSMVFLETVCHWGELKVLAASAISSVFFLPST